MARPRCWHAGLLVSLAGHAGMLAVIAWWEAAARAPAPPRAAQPLVWVESLAAPVPPAARPTPMARAADPVARPAPRPAPPVAAQPAALAAGQPVQASEPSPSPAAVPVAALAPRVEPAPSPALPAGTAGSGAQVAAAAAAAAIAPPALQQAQPDYAHSPPPVYPSLLRDMGVAGIVWLRVWVDAAGHPGQVHLLRGSGWRLLDESALQAVRRWRFRPARRGDDSVASWVEFPVRFTLTP